ncbi:tripartite tricarboxylate transporter substrate-binding protein [Xanthobacter sp. 91]|uniref:tripartite tricarboxylate transporter substrate-binding protein n=1 Tax=Xanthobacter sp. 91 TaxID=1117244 RepID=UPI0012DC5E34|nr:tripartite tricarboxylate transporter substrate-binding protein [Xanthobacter sp. 91]
MATLIALALGAAAPISAARAADYPTRPVTVVVPYAPGGQTDAFARIMAEALRESLGQPVIVDNKPGAGTMIGSEYVARAAPDGYTILVATPGVVVAPFFTDRSKDVINRGGLKVASVAVEEVLYRHPAIREAAVVAIPHPALGEDVAACVVAREGATLDVEDLSAFCARSLADYARPRRWLVIDELPKNPMGKVLKKELRQRLAATAP